MRLDLVLNSTEVKEIRDQESSIRNWERVISIEEHRRCLISITLSKITQLEVEKLPLIELL